MNMATAQSDVYLNPELRINLFSIASIAVFTQFICSVAHEVLGHALMAALSGGSLLHVSSVDADYNIEHLTVGLQRLIHSAGILMNFIVGIVVAIIAKQLLHASSNTRYFLWLLCHVNFFIGGGYMMALSFAGFGDVDAFVTGLPNPVFWKTALTLIGAVISFATLKHGVRTLDPFLGNEYGERRRRGRALTIFPYLVSGIMSVIAGLFNPVGMVLVAMSAAASSFGGQAFLAWMAAFIRIRKSGEPVELLTPVFSKTWIFLGILAFIVDVVVLGPGLPR
ncbi:hypothetical protein ACFQI7_33450 [Paenibacillus allorhizosphaerae]|uniref:hypothetical protein n=1 Tax=Paenibacillus allorhizosphaerae TaxID=2849866 RepID=UPI001C4026E4|nr:hypothetical protein [Paenibacillus allorhizosphaerae]